MKPKVGSRFAVSSFWKQKSIEGLKAARNPKFDEGPWTSAPSFIGSLLHPRFQPFKTPRSVCAFICTEDVRGSVYTRVHIICIERTVHWDSTYNFPNFQHSQCPFITFILSVISVYSNIFVARSLFLWNSGPAARQACPSNTFPGLLVTLCFFLPFNLIFVSLVVIAHAQ